MAEAIRRAKANAPANEFAGIIDSGPSDANEGFANEWASLQALVDDSDLIVVGKISSCASTEAPPNSGEIFQTGYSVSIERVFKGSATGSVNFITEGGEVAYPNGTTIRLRSVAWDHIKVGDRCLLFLRSQGGSPYWIDRSTAGLVRLPADAGAVEPLSKYSSSRRVIEPEVNGLTEQALLAKLQALVTARAHLNR